MHDPIDAGDRLIERFGVGEIGLDKMLVVAKVRGPLEIAQA